MPKKEIKKVGHKTPTTILKEKPKSSATTKAGHVGRAKRKLQLKLLNRPDWVDIMRFLPRDTYYTGPADPYPVTKDKPRAY